MLWCLEHPPASLTSLSELQSPRQLCPPTTWWSFLTSYRHFLSTNKKYLIKNSQWFIKTDDVIKFPETFARTRYTVLTQRNKTLKVEFQDLQQVTIWGREKGPYTFPHMKILSDSLIPKGRLKREENEYRLARYFAKIFFLGMVLYNLGGSWRCFPWRWSSDWHTQETELTPIW